MRRAWRSAARLGAELDVLWVRSARLMDEDEERSLGALRRLTSLLGAEFHMIESDDVDRTVEEFVAERGTTYVLTGKPVRGGALGRLREPLPMRLVRRLDGVDVRIVADRAERRETAP